MTIEVDVRDLLGGPGTSRSRHVTEAIEGLATELARVPDDAPVDAQLLFESIVEGVLATGDVRGVMVLTCARCLNTFDGEFDLHVTELFTADAAPGDDEYPIVDGWIDLEPMLRDTIVPRMPFAPLCREDCLGLCERCGGDRNLGECSCQEVVDLRWAPLSNLKLEGS